MIKSIPEIIFEEVPASDGKIGVITLNRQQVLNALNHEMFIALDGQLAEWQQNATIKAVVIQAAEGRAFCAGGDIRSAYERKLKNDPTLIDFFRDEYRMNLRIHHYPKPYIALLDGITMGGGVGVSIHGSHRIGTERLVFAMPETQIGFYPDVGATYFLSRLPHQFGIYLGLTGARIGYADCLDLGIINEVIDRDSLSKIIPALSKAETLDKNSVTHILKQFSISAPTGELSAHQEEIETCFAKNTIEEILHALESHPSEWCQQTAAVIKAKSPTSLKITLQALHKASKLDIDACMQMDYRLTYHFMQGHDFFEGVRAAIIDKDQKPQWKPVKLEEVNTKEVDKYFSPLVKELV